MSVKIFIMVMMISPIAVSFHKKDIKKLYENAVYQISIENFYESKKKFITILQNEPAFYPPDDASPKIKSIFNLAKKTFLKEKHIEPIFLDLVIKENQVCFKALTPKIASKIVEVLLWIKPGIDSIYTFYRLTPKAFDKKLFEITLSLKQGLLYHYYLSVKGEYEHEFLSLGSPVAPKSLFLINKKPLTKESFALKEGMWDKIFEGWPLILGTAVFIVGSITFSLMKINT